MTAILVGPMLRNVGTDAATIFLEADGPCEVTILDHVARTFHVAGHHYALVAIEGLEADTVYPYEVRIDGDVQWPGPGSKGPASAVRTLPDDGTLTLAFGSCRVAGPRSAPLGIDRVLRRYDPSLDALAILGRQLMDDDGVGAPDMLLLLGDQAYADIAPERAIAFARQRRDLSRPPGEAMADFEEYTRLYRESWADPAVRWLLSSVPSAMIFDDHELADDWRASREWLEDAHEQAAWDGRLAGSLMSYWIYQHLGNLSPSELADDPLYLGLCEDEDGHDRLREAVMADDARAGSRWSFVRELGVARLVVLDARATRVLDEDGRDMFDEAEWDRVAAALAGADHLLLASSVPVVYAEGFHHIQAWSERVAGGAWGKAAARVAERLRRAMSLSGWPAFEGSFDRLMELLGDVGSGSAGPPPQSITILSGDVHHGYVARVAWPEADGVRTTVHQVVSSPFRNPLLPHERLAQRAAASRVGSAVTRAMAAAARTSKPRVEWERLEGLEFANQVATLTLSDAGLDLRAERAVHARDGHALRTTWQRTLIGPAAASGEE